MLSNGYIPQYCSVFAFHNDRSNDIDTGDVDADFLKLPPEMNVLLYKKSTGDERSLFWLVLIMAWPL